MARERDGLLTRLLILFSLAVRLAEAREAPLLDLPTVDDPDPFAFLRIMAMIFWRGRRLERALLNLDFDDDDMAALFICIVSLEHLTRRWLQ